MLLNSSSPRATSTAMWGRERMSATCYRKNCFMLRPDIRGKVQSEQIGIQLSQIMVEQRDCTGASRPGRFAPSVPICRR